MVRRDISLENYQLSAVARLFSSCVVKELAKKGKSPLLARLALTSGLLNYLDMNQPIGALFDEAFMLLKRKEYRHEYIYKAALTHKVLLGKHSLQTASMVSEFRVGECKADIAILNGTSTVYEIKSERDSLAKLQKQIMAYRNVFATVNVITGANHITEVMNNVPIDVGVMLLSDRFQITTVREAIDLPERTSPSMVFDSIQLKESKAILKLLGIDVPDLPNTLMNRAMKEMFTTLDPIETQKHFIAVLKKTRSLLHLNDFIESLPKSIQTAAITTPLRKSDYNTLVSVMDEPISNTLQWS